MTFLKTIIAVTFVAAIGGSMIYVTQTDMPEPVTPLESEELFAAPDQEPAAAEIPAQDEAPKTQIINSSNPEVSQPISSPDTNLPDNSSVSASEPEIPDGFTVIQPVAPTPPPASEPVTPLPPSPYDIHLSELATLEPQIASMTHQAKTYMAEFLTVTDYQINQCNAIRLVRQDEVFFKYHGFHMDSTKGQEILAKEDSYKGEEAGLAEYQDCIDENNTKFKSAAQLSAYDAAQKLQAELNDKLIPAYQQICEISLGGKVAWTSLINIRCGL